MHDSDIKIVEDFFKKYYFEFANQIHVPSNPLQREFGYQKFNSGMIRHLSIKNDNELHLMLIKNSPSDVYCSNAYYSFPNLPMNEKDWQKADLIFDIDAKDLNLQCRDFHVIHQCTQCLTVFQKNKNCPNCKSDKIESKSITCTNCITAAKNEVKKLLEILTVDFGISMDNIEIYFSGNEGFHVYAYNTQFEKLSSKERNELVDYILFHGAIPETFGMKRTNPDRTSFPSLDERGWRGRVARFLFHTKSQRSKIISQIIKGGYANFQNTLQTISQSIGAKIDPNVTMDVHRIFRLPGSLNSKSGMAKVLCKNIDSFEPYTEACLLDDKPVEVVANCPVEFSLNATKFGPYNNENVTVPGYAAIYMICKGLATNASKI